MILGLTDKLKEFEAHCPMKMYLRDYGQDMYEFKKGRVNLWTRRRINEDKFKSYFIQIDKPKIGEQLDLFYDQNLNKDIYNVEHK